jgi:hypothetical protein
MRGGQQAGSLLHDVCEQASGMAKSISNAGDPFLHLWHHFASRILPCMLHSGQFVMIAAQRWL